MKDLGVFLEEKRKEKNKHKSDIYKALGISQNTYTSWITDTKMSLKNYVAICNLLNIHPAEYFNTQKIEHLNTTNNTNHSISTDDQNTKELIRQNGVLIDVIDRLTK